MADKVSVRPLRSHSSSNLNRRSCERRGSKRLLCSDLVQVSWQNANGERFREIAILENLSLSGVGLFAGVPLPPGMKVDLAGSEAVLTGRVKQCAFRENGYVVGIELDDDSKWAQEPGCAFVPQHLLDVSLLDLE
jgi:hypothetical protein